MRYHTLLAIFLCLVTLTLPGCAVNALTRENLKRAWEVREQDKRPVIDDAAYAQMPAGQKAYFLPKSLDDAAHFERDNALRLAK